MEEPSIIYQFNLRGKSCSTQVPIDTTKPIMPVRDGGLGIGEAYVIYHTNGVSTSLVIAYLGKRRIQRRVRTLRSSARMHTSWLMRHLIALMKDE